MAPLVFRARQQPGDDPARTALASRRLRKSELLITALVRQTTRVARKKRRATVRRTKTEPRKARTFTVFALSALEKSPEIADNDASCWIARIFLRRKDVFLVARRPAVGAIAPDRPQLHVFATKMMARCQSPANTSITQVRFFIRKVNHDYQSRYQRFWSYRTHGFPCRSAKLQRHRNRRHQRPA